RLALVGVHDEVARERVGRQERPFLRGRESGAASASKPRELYLLLHVGRVALREHCAQRVVGAGRERALDRPRIVGAFVETLRDDPSFLNHAGDPETVRAARFPDRYSSTKLSAISGVSCSWNS